MKQHSNFTGLFITVYDSTVAFERDSKRRTIDFEGPSMPAEDLEDILSGISNAPEMAGVLNVDADEMAGVLNDLVPFA